MKDNRFRQNAAKELQDIWDGVSQTEGLHSEIKYRLQKLSCRLTPLMDKMYLKTVKAGETLAECKEMTVSLQEHINAQGDEAFYILTNLEQTFENLLRKTYEFRVKAG